MPTLNPLAINQNASAMSKGIFILFFHEKDVRIALWPRFASLIPITPEILLNPSRSFLTIFAAKRQKDTMFDRGVPLPFKHFSEDIVKALLRQIPFHSFSKKTPSFAIPRMHPYTAPFRWLVSAKKTSSNGPDAPLC